MEARIRAGRRGRAAAALAAVTLALGAVGCGSDDVGGDASGALDAQPAVDAVSEAAGADGATSGDPGLDAAVDPGCRPGEPVLVGEAVNARDLGGVPLGDGATACGELFRGAPLGRLSANGCAELAALGVRTVIDLRVDAERETLPEAPCVAVSASIIAAPMPIPYGLAPADYLADLHAADALRAAFHAFGDPAAYPIYFHCTYGRDRTGVLAAVVLSLLGASREDIVAEYRLTERAGLGSHPESLAAVLDELARVGGTEAYLLSIGVTADELGVLRTRATMVNGLDGQGD